jgi:hypothetical protein
LKETQVKRFWFAVLLIVAVGAAASPQSPYVGEDSREVKALSPQEMDDLLNGRGMGLAKAAELNQYPGPRHVLDLAKELKLTAEQRTQTKAVFETMAAEAKSFGARLVELERDLDRRFAERTIDAKSLGLLLSKIGELQGLLRSVHLYAHIEQRSLLSHHQIQHYDELRGYGEAHATRPGHSH